MLEVCPTYMDTSV